MLGQSWPVLKAYPENQVPEPQNRGQDGEDALDHVLRHLHDLEGQPQVVELDDVIDAVECDAARLVEVVVLRRWLQEEPLGKLFVSLEKDSNLNSLVSKLRKLIGHLDKMAAAI